MSSIATEIDSTNISKIQESTTPIEPCANCGTPVAEGDFCSKCGQENTDKIVPLKEFVLDIFDEFFSIDTKITRSLKPLLLKPGFLTKEYIMGRRVNYLLPSRMYFIISVVFFFLVQNFDPVGADTAQDFLKERGIDYMNPAIVEKFNAEVADKLPTFLLTAIPLFALFLKLLYFRSKRFFVEHLIFSFHFYSFVLIGIVPTLFIKMQPLQDILAYAAIMAFPLFYLFVAFKKVYEQNTAKTLLKALAAWFVFFTSLALTFYAIQVWAVASL
jgi:hypothetical protein